MSDFTKNSDAEFLSFYSLMFLIRKKLRLLFCFITVQL